MTPAQSGDAPPRRAWKWARRAGLAAVVLPLAFYALCFMGLFYLRFFPPLTTGVQVQRMVERVLADAEPAREYRWRPLEEISPHFRHAVIAAEDARFYRHYGFDWKEVQTAWEEADEGQLRGASTLAHQLIKNLYFTTHRNPVRKLYEWALTPPAYWILGRERILELYVNVVELGPGVFGAEAGARHHYGIPAERLSRRQAASLAAILPAPLRRRPQAMVRYTAIIQARMDSLGW